MPSSAGRGYVRFGDRPWDRRTEDRWPPLVKRVYRDDTLAVNIIWYGRGVTEPRHVHDGTHATWVLVGGATMDAETIGPCDLVYGPGGVPHGPLVYEMGCMLFGTLYGGALHSAVEGDATSPTADGLPPHLATQRDHPWEADGHVFGIGETKTLVRDPARDYTARMLRVPAGSTAPRHSHPGFHAAVVMSGRAIVEGETLGPWDVLLGPGEVPHGPILFPEDCLMLVNAVGDRRPR